jgi:hypothetical protein
MADVTPEPIMRIALIRSYSCDTPGQYNRSDYPCQAGKFRTSVCRKRL